MFCPKCGKESADNAQFCTGCGNSLTAKAEPNQEYYREPQPQGVPNGEFAPPTPPAYTGPAGLIRSKIQSPLFIVAMIAFSAYVVFSLIGSAGGSVISTPVLSQLIYEFDIPIEILSIVNAINTGSVVGTFIGFIPQILVLIGGWMLYTSASNKQSSALNPAGMSTIRISTVISVVITCIAAALLLLGLLIVAIVAMGATSYVISEYTYGYGYGFGPGYGEISSVISAILVPVFLLVAAIFAFIIVYAVKAMTTVKTLQTAIKENAVRGKISSFVIGVCYVVGVLNALGAFVSVLNITSFLSSAGAGVSLFCFGMLLSDYQKSVYR